MRVAADVMYKDLTKVLPSIRPTLQQSCNKQKKSRKIISCLVQQLLFWYNEAQTLSCGYNCIHLYNIIDYHIAIVEFFA